MGSANGRGQVVGFHRDLGGDEDPLWGFVDMAFASWVFFSEGIRGPWTAERSGFVVTGQRGVWNLITLHCTVFSGGPWWLGIVGLGEAGGEV